MTQENKGDGAPQAEGPQDWHAFTARRLVGAEFRVAESDLAAPSRASAEVAFARQVAMYLAHTCYRLTYDEVADAFGRERTTVAHACAVVEDERDEGTPFCDKLTKLERRLRGLSRIVTGRPTSKPDFDGGGLYLA